MADMEITTTTTTKVDTAISFLVDQLTFFISPSAAIIKSAINGLFTSQNARKLKPLNIAAGTIVDIHSPKSVASNSIYRRRQPKPQTNAVLRAVHSLVYLPCPDL